MGNEYITDSCGSTAITQAVPTCMNRMAKSGPTCKALSSPDNVSAFDVEIGSPLKQVS